MNIDYEYINIGNGKTAVFLKIFKKRSSCFYKVVIKNHIIFDLKHFSNFV